MKALLLLTQGMHTLMDAFSDVGSGFGQQDAVAETRTMQNK